MIFAGILLLLASGVFAHLADGGNLFALFWALLCLAFGLDALIFGISLARLRRQQRAPGIPENGWLGPHSHFGLSTWKAGEQARHVGLQLWPTLALKLNLHWYTLRGVTHGPQDWPWWRLASFAAVRTNQDRPNPLATGWNVWIYTRRGAWCNHFAIDRRSPAQRGLFA